MYKVVFNVLSGILEDDNSIAIEQYFSVYYLLLIIFFYNYRCHFIPFVAFVLLIWRDKAYTLAEKLP